MFPLLKTGGLADVTGALPAAQIAEGLDTRVLLPGFPAIRNGVQDPQVVASRETFAGRMTLLFGHFNGVGGFVNGMVASHLLCHSGTINRHSLNGALLS
ncbi:glycogen synthase [Klebsiella quasipneumoniae]|nr:glycogen synthase [Klebsiella quasipneumoniae]